MKKLLLKDIATITGGQILQRITADVSRNDEIKDLKRKTITSKTISEGYINPEDVLINDYRVIVEKNKLTQEGDIIVKLSAPYYAVIIDKNNVGILVSSFCAIVREVKEISKEFLVAYLNSSICQRQLSDRAAGAIASMLSAGRLGELEIPVPSKEKQKEIGDFFNKTINNRVLLRKITELEQEKMATMIATMEK